MKIKFTSRYIARCGAGLFAGIKIYFPTSFCDDENTDIRWKNISIQFGFIVFVINININYAHKHTHTYRPS
jgi:hypothetical protein